MAKFAVLFLVALAFGQQIAGLSYEDKYYGGLGPYGGKYSKDVGFYNYPYAAKYGYDLQGGKYDQYYGGLYGGYPKQLILQVQAITNEFSAAFEQQYYGTEQTPRVYSVYAREFVQIIDRIIEQLQGEAAFSKNVLVEPIILRLREIQKEFYSIVGYSAFTGYTQLRFRFVKYVQELAGLIEKLIGLAQTPEVSNAVVKTIVQYFVYGVQKILYQYQSQYGVYGKGYEYGKGLGQYGQESYYPQAYGYGGYGQYTPYSQYANSKYAYGKYSPYDQYSYGKYAPYGLYAYGKSAPYSQSAYGEYTPYGQYAFAKYAPYGQYGYASTYGLQGQTVGQLVNQIQYVANKVVEQFQAGTYSDEYLRQFVYHQAQQLVQVLDHIIYMLQGYEQTDSIYKQVIAHFRQIQIELQQTLTTEVTSIYQIKAHFATYIQTIAAELQKLGLVAQSDLQTSYNVVIKKVLIQYLAYLRYFYYQVQGYTNDLGFGLYYPTLVSQFKTLGSGFSGLRDVTYNPVLAREYAQYVKSIHDRLNSQLYNQQGDDYVVPQQVLYRFKQILDIFPEDSKYGVTNWYGLLGDNVQGIADQIQNWIAYEPKYKGSYYYQTLPVDLLGDFLYATQGFHDALRPY